MVPLHDMIPLHELLRHVERYCQRRPEHLSGRGSLTSHNNSNLQPGIQPSAYWDNTRAEAVSFQNHLRWGSRSLFARTVIYATIKPLL